MSVHDPGERPPALRALLLLLSAIMLPGCLGVTSRIAAVGTTNCASQVEFDFEAKTARIELLIQPPTYSPETMFNTAYVDGRNASITVAISQGAETGSYLVDGGDGPTAPARRRLFDLVGTDEVVLEVTDRRRKRGILSCNGIRRRWYTYPCMALCPLGIPVDLVVDVGMMVGALVWSGEGSPE
jgi:hypothetical protein